MTETCRYWSIDQSALALFPDGTIVRDSHQCRTPIHRQDLNLRRTYEFRLNRLKLSSCETISTVLRESNQTFSYFTVAQCGCKLSPGAQCDLTNIFRVSHYQTPQNVARLAVVVITKPRHDESVIQVIQ